MPKYNLCTKGRCTQSSPASVRRRRWAAVSLAAGAVNIACAGAWAGTDNWQGGTSDWNTPANWDSGNVPLDGDTVNVINTDTSSPTIDYDYNGSAATLSSLTIDNTAGIETLSMQTAGLALTAGGEIIANTGTATLFQAASVNTITGSGAQLVIGSQAGSAGSYTLQDGTLQMLGASTTETIGGAGVGIFSQSGGLNSATGTGSQELIGPAGQYLQTGGMNTSFQLNIQSGLYSLSNGAQLSVGSNESLDFGAVINQTGGSNAVQSSILVGAQNSSSGYYLMTGGTLTAGFGDFVGYHGTGTFTQTDGTASFADLAVGYLTGSSGSYALGTSGMLTASTSSIIGLQGTGSFLQTGGIFNAGKLYVGEIANSSGSFELDNGTLSAGTEYIGYGSNGFFNQTGGTNSLSAGHSLNVGYIAGATGTYILSNTGSLNVLGSENIGYGATGAASGSFEQDGGSNTIGSTSGNLSIGITANSNGIYTLNDGTLALTGSVTSETIGSSGTGSFIQTGGMNTVAGSGESIGVFSGSSGYYEQDGGLNNLTGPASNLNIAANPGASGLYFLTSGVLNAANIFVGGGMAGPGGTGSLIVSGSAQVTATGALTLYNAGGSDIIVNSGNLSAATANLNGPLTQNDGTITFQKITGAGQVVISGGLLKLTPGGGQSRLSSLVITGNGTMDLTTNSLALNYMPGNDPIAAVIFYLTQGYNNGTWTGPGIISSSAAANPNKFAVGYLDSTEPGGVANTVLVKVTLAGDTNLDGTVDFTDLFAMGKNLNTTGNDWSGGDFNYAANGAVDFNDLFMIGQNLNQTINSASVGLVQNVIPLSASVQTTQVHSTIVSTPEPSAIALAAVAAGSLLSRRRRRATRV